jgi:hypothetical protein
VISNKRPAGNIRPAVSLYEAPNIDIIVIKNYGPTLL